jgi:hypothetical protein
MTRALAAGRWVPGTIAGVCAALMGAATEHSAQEAQEAQEAAPMGTRCEVPLPNGDLSVVLGRRHCHSPASCPSAARPLPVCCPPAARPMGLRLPWLSPTPRAHLLPPPLGSVAARSPAVVAVPSPSLAYRYR